MLIWKSIFIYRLLILFISTFSFLLFLYTVSWKYKSDYLHASIDILFYIMLHIINTTMKQSSIWCSYFRYKKGPDLNLPPSPLFVTTPLMHMSRHSFVSKFLPYLYSNFLFEFSSLFLLSIFSLVTLEKFFLLKKCMTELI